jgi:hypothetical protein
MKTSEHYPFQHLPEKQEFQLDVNGEVARVNYRIENNQYLLVYSEVPYQLRGQGIGAILVKETFKYLEKHQLKAKAICGYIALVAQRDEHWKNIIE